MVVMFWIGLAVGAGAVGLVVMFGLLSFARSIRW